MQVSLVSFGEAKGISDKEEGLVLLGTGGDLQEWITGVEDLLIAECDAQPGVFGSAHELTTTGGRTDLLLVLNMDKGHSAPQSFRAN